MKRLTPPTTPREARSDAMLLLASLTDHQLEARWNFGPTTGAVLRGIASHPEQVRCSAGRLSADAVHPAISTVYVRPPRPFRIAPGPSQFSTTYDEEKYVHPDWCECAQLNRYFCRDLGLDPQSRPNEILPQPHLQGLAADDARQWFMLWWD